MSIRNTLFKTFNALHRAFQVDSKFLPYTCTQRNQALIKNHESHAQMEFAAKKAQNYKNIINSKLDEFQKLEYNVISDFNERGKNNSYVDPQSVIYQLDRIEVLRKLKILEQNSGAFHRHEAECLKLIAKVHLEEPNAQENLEKFVKEHPACKRLLYLGQI